MFVLLFLLVFFYAMWYTGYSNLKSGGAANITLWQALGIPSAVTQLLSVQGPAPPTITMSPIAQNAISAAQQVNGGAINASSSTSGTSASTAPAAKKKKSTTGVGRGIVGRLKGG